MDVIDIVKLFVRKVVFGCIFINGESESSYLVFMK